MTDTKPHYQFSVDRDVEEIPCDCASPCSGIHRQPTGPKRITFEAEGHRFTSELAPGTDKWEEAIVA